MCYESVAVEFLTGLRAAQLLRGLIKATKSHWRGNVFCNQIWVKAGSGKVFPHRFPHRGGRQANTIAERGQRLRFGVEKISIIIGSEQARLQRVTVLGPLPAAAHPARKDPPSDLHRH